MEKYIKDFDRWNEEAKMLVNKKRPYFKVGQIWWLHFGQNIGVEINGKGNQFLRPVLIVKKYNHCSFWGLSLTSSEKKSNYKESIGVIDNKQAFAVLSQPRYMDSGRLVKKITRVTKSILDNIKKKASQINFD